MATSPPGAAKTPTETPLETQASPSITLEQAAKLVQCKPEDIEAFKDYGDFVVVVTVAGQKLRADRTGAVPDDCTDAGGRVTDGAVADDSSTSSLPGGRNGKK